jgi:hypothetical protein
MKGMKLKKEITQTGRARTGKEKPNLKKIGNLTSELTSTAGTKATRTTKSDGSLTASETTGEQSERASATGTELSSTGSAQAIRTVTSISAADLAGLSAGEANRKLRDALPPSVALRPVYSSNLNNHTPVAYRASETNEEAIAILEASLMPVDQETLERALTELALLTKAREDDSETEDMRAALYMGRMSTYPADAVIHVCRSWANDNVFWPAWAELRERLESRVQERRKMLDALL